MYYLRINEEDPNKLVYYCRKCGNEDTLITGENLCISKTLIKKSQQSFSHIINKYTKYDPTLPRINNILCPNSECISHKISKKDLENEKLSNTNEIIYIRYDDINMKYIYLCCNCDTIWEINDKN
jgi:hypothetical protein